MLDLQDLKKDETKDNAPGAKTQFLFAPESYFAKDGIKKVGPDGVVIAGPHEFKSGMGFVEIYGTLDTGELKLDAAGERDSRTKTTSLVFNHPGNTVAAAAFDKAVKNAPGILLVKELDGTLVQLGTEGMGVEVSGAYSGGKVSGGYRGWVFTVTGFQSGMQHYVGATPLKSEADTSAPE